MGPLLILSGGNWNFFEIIGQDKKSISIFDDLKII